MDGSWRVYVMAQEKGRETAREGWKDKKEISKLKREMNKLRKDIRRLQDIRDEATEDPPDTLARIEPPKSLGICGGCGARDLKMVDLGRVVLLVCGACRWRKRVS
jgi:hypothetical protein